MQSRILPGGLCWTQGIPCWYSLHDASLQCLHQQANQEGVFCSTGYAFHFSHLKFIYAIFWFQESLTNETHGLFTVMNSVCNIFVFYDSWHKVTAMNAKPKVQILFQQSQIRNEHLSLAFSIRYKNIKLILSSDLQQSIILCRKPSFSGIIYISQFLSKSVSHT